MDFWISPLKSFPSWIFEIFETFYDCFRNIASAGPESINISEVKKKKNENLRLECGRDNGKYVYYKTIYRQWNNKEKKGLILLDDKTLLDSLIYKFFWFGKTFILNFNQKTCQKK